MRLMGRGVSNCAVCDGFFFKGKRLAVVGGGDTAMEEATFLTNFAASVTVIHRRDKLRAGYSLQKEALSNPKIDFLWDSAVVGLEGEKKLEAIRVRNLKSGEERPMRFDGLFVAIGYDPNTAVFRGQLEMDQNGYITPKNETETNVRGVFVAGDVRDYKYRQAITAAADGCKAALDAERYLKELELERHQVTAPALSH
jgi:thioredoxin reductase (NADPH)